MESTKPLPDLSPSHRCLVMGVLNVTPDSFSDGGRWTDTPGAVERGLHLAADGADIVDVGGESTRPGADRIPAQEELRRIRPVVSELVRHGVVVSVDTMRAEVAAEAVDLGARLVNDVSGGRADVSMADVVARSGVSLVVSHWRGHSREMYSEVTYTDVVTDVRAELATQMATLTDAGVATDQLIVDPGLGFAKSVAAGHNWALLTRLAELASLGRPILVGASRKRFLGQLLRSEQDTPRPPEERDEATVALTTLAAFHGVWGVRVHEVAGNADAVRVAAAWRSGAEPAAAVSGGLR